MKSYYPSKKYIKHYKVVGIVSLVLAIIIFLITPSLTNINNIQKIFYIILLILLPSLYITRNKRLILTIDEDELYFNDGLLSKVTIDLNRINYIEYHPDLKIRIYTFNKKRKPILINNVFSLEDQKAILSDLKNKRHRIEIHYLERPNKIISKKN